MALWYASVVPGVEGLAARLICSHGADAEALQGALLIQAERPPEARYLNNVFRVLIKERCGGLNDALYKVRTRLAGLRFPHMAGATFRVVVMESGVLRAIPARDMAALEGLCARASGLAPRRANPDVEIWLNIRSEGFYTLMIRMSKHRPFDKALRPGQLRPDLCALLACIPPPGRTALDPFAGSGALAHALRARFDRVTAMDIDEGSVQAIQKAYPKLEAHVGDARETGLPSASLDAVVTDPPWGMYECMDDIGSLYAGFIKEATRLLKPGGTLVMLSAFDAAEALTLYLGTFERHPVLISGRRAAVYAAKKT